MQPGDWDRKNDCGRSDHPDLGHREVTRGVTPDTTLGDLIYAHFENSCFDSLYLALARMQRGETDMDPACRLMTTVGFSTGMDMSVFVPPWLQRVRELLDEIAKEEGYGPPSHPGSDVSRADPSHED